MKTLYLQANAFEIAFDCNQYKTIAFIQEHFKNFDDYLRHTVQELIRENNLEHDNLLKKFSGFKLA